MTKNDFLKLDDFTTVWFQPPYLVYKFPATVKTLSGEKGVYVNFFGDGQCFFSCKRYNEKSFYSWIEECDDKMNK